MKYGESAKLKRDIQLSIKNTEFLQQQMRRGVIEETPLKDIQSKPSGVANFGVETAKRDANGVTLSERPQAILTEKALVNDAKGSLEVNGQGKVRPACFSNLTWVHTYDEDYGQVLTHIEYIRHGQLVLSRCDETGELAYRPVVEFFEHDDRETWLVSHTDERGFTEHICTTTEHPFWVRGRGWVPAGQLEVGDLLEVAQTVFLDDKPSDLNPAKALGSYTLKTSTVVATKYNGYRDKVYNFEVEGFHTYFVGGLGVWVHNTKVGEQSATVPISSSSGNLPKGAPPKLSPRDTAPENIASHRGEITAAEKISQYNREVIYLKANKDINTLGKSNITDRSSAIANDLYTKAGEPRVGTPDYLIDGRAADCFTPQPIVGGSGGSLTNIRSSIKEKTLLQSPDIVK